MRAVALRTDLGDLQRSEAARERDLQVVVDVLAAEHQHRVLLEGGAHGVVSGVVVGDVGERDAAQFGAKAGTESNDLHGETSVIFRPAFSPPGVKPQA